MNNNIFGNSPFCSKNMNLVDVTQLTAKFSESLDLEILSIVGVFKIRQKSGSNDFGIGEDSN